jgi:hypothetical protein
MPFCLTLTRPFEGLNIVLCGDPAQLAPVRARPLKQLAFTSSTPSPSLVLTNPFARQRATTLKLCFTPSFGRRSNCQATEDDWRWLQTRYLACLSAEKNVRFDTSKYVVATSDLCNRLDYKWPSSPVLDVCACDSDDNDDGERADNDAPKRRKYGPHSRPRDKMETEENVAGPTLDDEEIITCIPFSLHSTPLLTVQQPPPPCIPISLGPHTLGYQNPSLPDIDLSIVPPPTLSTRSRKVDN